MKLYYAELPLEKDVLPFEVKDKEELITKARDLMTRGGKKHLDRVYLYAPGERENIITVSCDFNDIVGQITNGKHFDEHHIHEYETYEGAFKTATDMMETHRLGFEASDNVMDLKSNI